MCCGQFCVKSFWKYVLVNKQQMCMWSFVALTHVESRHIDPGGQSPVMTLCLTACTCLMLT
jgi:hypothetical protein